MTSRLSPTFSSSADREGHPLGSFRLTVTHLENLPKATRCFYAVTRIFWQGLLIAFASSVRCATARLAVVGSWKTRLQSARES